MRWRGGEERKKKGGKRCGGEDRLQIEPGCSQITAERARTTGNVPKANPAQFLWFCVQQRAKRMLDDTFHLLIFFKRTSL